MNESTVPKTCPCPKAKHKASSKKPKSTLENISRNHEAFTISRKVALKECILAHVLPVSVTIGVLQLSFCSVYWADPTAYYSFNEILNSLQYAAKALEILIVFSISRIVLHRTRYLMAKKTLPLGCMAVGYEPTLLNLLRPEFWSSLRPRSRGGKSEWFEEILPSISLLVVCVFLSLVAGPSSAVAILPNLDWWSVEPFQNIRVSTWVLGQDDLPLWPTHLTKELITDPRCYETGANQVYSCPSQAWQTIQYWTEDVKWRRTAPNLTIQVQSFNTQRYLTSSSDVPFKSGWTAASSAPEWISMDMGYFYPFMTTQLGYKNLSRPMMVPRLADTGDGLLLKPLVETECQQFDSSDEQSIVFPHKKLWAPAGVDFGNQTWPVPKNSWSLFNNNQNESLYIKFNWVDLQSHPNHPSVGAVITTPTPILNKSGWFQGTNVFACSINARWIPADLRFDPSGAAIVDEVLDPASYIRSGTLDREIASRNISTRPTYQQITIDRLWADSLEIRPANFDASFDPPHKGVGIPELVGRYGTWYTPYPGGPGNTSAPVFFSLSQHEDIGEAWALSTLLNLYLTSGLTYVQMSATTLVMVEDLVSPAQSYVVPLSTYDDFKKTGTVQSLLSYLGTPSSDQKRKRDPDSHVGNWTKIDWQVYRYGYGWGNHNTTIRLAAAALLSYVILATVHMALLLHRGYVPREGWKSIGELLLLALESARPAVSAPPSYERKPQVRWWKRIWSWRVPEASTRKEVWTQRIHLPDLKKGIVFSDEVAGDRGLRARGTDDEMGRGDEKLNCEVCSSNVEEH